MFKKILVANRGKSPFASSGPVARWDLFSGRVFGCGQKRPHAALADQAVAIGPALARKSYLNGENIIKAALETKADAIHPGYGFLAENAPFAKACVKSGLAFIGPTADTMAKAGDKARAREILMDRGVPVTPGSAGILHSKDEALKAAEKVGWPVILKASGGGGGRGMRVAQDKKQLEAAFDTASGEASAAFGNPDLYLEKYIRNPRHIEVQLLADQHGNAVHLGERDCSIQKRHQKLIEEAPSPFVDENLREKMGKAALSAAAAMNYENAGTIEFLVDEDKNFYFMEVNARIQVEHPVTELVTGCDLVAEQIRIAAGLPLSMTQKEIRLSGWAFECRINAADPDADFMPSPGEIERVSLPGGPGVRVDTYIHDGCFVPPFYDALILKLSVWHADRARAAARMRRALSELSITGISHTTPFHQRVFSDTDFLAGKTDTGFLERFLEKNRK